MAEAETTLDRLNENPEVLKGMLQMPDEMNAQMVESRREEVFDFLWTTLSLEKVEMLSHIQEREQQLLDSDMFNGDEADALPEWLCRMEAQDIILEMLYDEFKSEGVL